MNNNIQLGRFYSKWYILLFWVLGVAFSIGTVFNALLDSEFSYSQLLLLSLVNTILLWTGSMSIVIFVWRKFPWESRPKQHLWVEVVLVVCLLFVYVVFSGLFLSFFGKSEFSLQLSLKKVDVLFTVLITILIITIHEAVFFYRQWKYHFSKSVQLEKENIEARYNMLKAQMNPHFLFNSLNSLMGLLGHNSAAEKYVQDLSEYLRYVLQSNSRELVELSEEIDSVRKFLNLQKLRFNDNLQVELSISDVSLHEQLPPLVVQMLVDNCIKHNVISTSRPLKIKIYDDENYIVVENNLQRKFTSESTGQGLKNIEGRYRFFSTQPINISTTDECFLVRVPLISPKSNE